VTTSGERAVAGAGLALASLAGLAAVVAVFLSTAAGQRVDETALQGARIGRGHLIEGALTMLGLVSVVGLALATATVAVIAFSRRRGDLALAAVALVVGANMTTQVLKHGVLDRPDLGIDTLTLNSLPSGHSTVAASVAVALVLVVPARLRGPLALFSTGTAALTGVATLAAGWHRPSDVVAGYLVVGAWLGIVTIGLAVVGPMGAQPLEPRVGGRFQPSLAAVLLALLAVVALAVAAIAYWRTLGLDSIARERGDLLLSYGGGAAAIAGVAALLLVAALVTAPQDEPAPRTETLSARGAARSR